MSEIPDSTEVDIRTVTTSPSRTSTCASSKARSEGRELPMHSHPTTRGDRDRRLPDALGGR